MTIYNLINWVNDSPPAINASNLNYMDEGIQRAHIEIASQAIEVASVGAYASTLYANISANGSAISANSANIFAVESAQGALATQVSLLDLSVSGQAAAVASSAQAVASLIPAVDYQSSQIAALLATQAAHASSIFAVVATQTDHDLQLSGLTATQSQLVSISAAQSSGIAEHSTQIYELQQQASSVGGSLVYMNRTGYGPVDLWLEAAPVEITATGGLPRAVGIKYVPAADLTISSGVSELSFELLSNQGVPSAPLSFSAAILGPTGVVEAWVTPTSVPIVATSSVVDTISAPLETDGFTMKAGEPHYMVLASDDAYSFSVLGQDELGAAAAQVRWNRGLSYGWNLSSGLNLASYLTLPISTATTYPPTGYPATFVEPN